MPSPPGLTLTALFALSFTGCTADDLSRYPGAHYVSGGSRAVGGAMVHRTVLRTAEPVQSVLDYYVKDLSGRPGWSGPTTAHERAVWANDNMYSGTMKGEIIDPMKRGAMVVMLKSASRTSIHLIEYVPD